MSHFDDPLFDPWSEAVTEPTRGKPPVSPGWARRSRPARPSLPAPRRTPGPSAPLHEAAEQVRRLAARLEEARHHTVLDDRTAEDPPSLRFRFEPWRGPWDGPADAPPILEIALDEATGGLVVRIWADPRAGAPTSVIPVAPGGPAGTPLTNILLDFVERTLRLS